MRNSKHQLDEKLGANKMGKNKIKKSPLPNNAFSGLFHENPVPNVNHIDKNDFKNVVQHLTGLQSNESEITRLQKIRPPPLTNVNIQYLPQYYTNQTQVVNNLEPYWASYALRPNLVESPISAFMRRFQMFDYDTSRDNKF